MTALALKLIACITMLLDHIGYCSGGPMTLRLIGRLAFPIYVFLLTEGFRRTSDRRRYAFRLALFAVLSQVPFSLMCRGRLWDPYLNVMVTLLASFLSIWLLDSVKENRLLRLLAWILIGGLCLVFDLQVIHADYGAKGILLALVFFYGVPYVRAARPGSGQWMGRAALLLALAFLAVFHWTLLQYGEVAFSLLAGNRKTIPAVPDWTLAQLSSLLSVPLILLYNGKAGPRPKDRLARKAVQYAFYAFYPVHMLLLYWIL